MLGARPFVLLLASVLGVSACRSTVTPDAAPPSEESAVAREERVEPKEARPVLPRIVAPADIPVPAPDVAAALAEAKTEGLRHADVLTPLYVERKGAMVLASLDQVLTPAGAAAVAAIDAAPAHALDPSRYHAERVRGLKAELTSALAEIEQAGPIAIDPRELTALEDAALAERKKTGVEPDGHALVQRALSQGATGPLGVTAAAVAARSEKLAAAARTAAQLEVVLGDALLAYASDMRTANTHTMDAKDLEKRGAEAIEKERLDAFYRQLAAEPEDAEALVAQLPPQVPQYPRLVKAFADYRALCDKGPWPTVDFSARKPLEHGATGPAVDQLRKRLRAEGYDAPEAPPGAPIDQALIDAINAYKETHQMEVDGKLDKTMAGSLNVSCEDRVAQIRVTLERWRESRIKDPSGYFVFVNIPDFHGEVWDQNKLLHRFRVVVGNRTRGWDPKERKTTFKNATPRLAAAIQYLEFNPYWNVPDRIREEELEPEIAKDSEYLRKHGYEVVEENGREWIRQLPGSGNALGKVKFLFPNPWNVYLHDTNQRKLFSRPTRAYSHGCMRVHEPLQLAELLLTRENKWDPSIVESRKFTPVNLDTPIPIYVEYYVVRVDDQGRVHFNLDVYGLDKKRLERG